MKKMIEVAVSYEQVNKVGREIDFPETPKYYKKEDDSRFFARGLYLFAIIPTSSKSYLLIQVERNKQECNDFVPVDDCRSSHWLKSSGLRHQAFEIITQNKYLDGFTEITEEEFNSKRIELLNDYQKINH